MDFVNLKKEDKEMYDLMKKELKRQEKGIELIASENFVSRAVTVQMFLSFHTHHHVFRFVLNFVTKCLPPPKKSGRGTF